MTSYKLVFRKRARKEWDDLDAGIRRQFQKKLAERLNHPHVPSARLSGLPDCYKIKLRKVGYRLIYRVDDERIVVIVIAIGKRERGEAYEAALRRLDDET